MERENKKANDLTDSHRSGEESKRSLTSGPDVKKCPICLTNISNRALIDTCLHEFCFQCINQWSLNHNQCPVCRQIYQNILYNIVSNELFEQISVQFVSEEEEEVENDPILVRMLLYIQLLSLRNRTRFQRQRVSQMLRQLSQTLSQLNGNENELRERIQDLTLELEQLDEDITQFDAILRLDVPTETQLLNVLNGRVEESNLFYLQFEDIEEMNLNLNQIQDNESIATMNSSSLSIDFGYVADDEREEQSDGSNDRQNTTNSAKRRHSSDSDDWPQSCKRKKN